MNRRTFLNSTMGALGAATVAGRAGALRSTAAPSGVDFDVTGLFAFRVGRRSKQIRILMVDALKAKLKDAHAPMLVMNADDVDTDSGLPVNQLHIGPSYVRMANGWMATWSLVGLNVWVSSAHTGFEDNDPAASFTFYDSAIGCDPDPIDRDEGWASIRWFAGLEDLVGGPFSGPMPSRQLKFDAKKLTTEFRFTRGTGAGRAPRTKCEQYRKHRVGSNAPRTFATQMHLQYESAPGFLPLMVADRTVTVFKGVIPIKVRADRFTPVLLMNVPLTHRHNPPHYQAFYKLVGVSGQAITFAEPCMPTCTMGSSTTTTSTPPAATHNGANPPDPDCIPPTSFLD